MTAPTSVLARPLYLQVRDILVDRITGGTWKAGSAIPNEQNLAQELGVSIGTIRKALEYMKHERLLVRRQGRGTFVVDQATGDMVVRFSNLRDTNASRISGVIASTEVVHAVASAHECHRLRLEANDPVIRVRRVRHHAGHPFMVEDSVLPAARYPMLTDTTALTHRLVVLAQENGLMLGRAYEKVSPVMPVKSVAEALEIDGDTPILRLERTAYTVDNMPVEWRIAFCNLVDSFYLAEME